MKEKTNLELFKNDIVYGLNHGTYDTLYQAMIDIYKRETGVERVTYTHVLDWLLDSPLETLSLDKFTYNFIKQYYSCFVGVDSDNWYDEPINWYAALEILLRMNVIPPKYATMPFNKFVRIISLKESNK